MPYPRSFRSVLLGAGAALAASHVCAAQAASEATTHIGELLVTAPRQESTAREKQAQAINIVNVQSAETIAKYPDINASEALSRIPGVSLSIDTAEGRYVNIRGIDGNLNGATYGGVPLLNTQATLTYFNFTGRAVEMDTVPIGAVDRIEVTKTGLPDHEAEGLGGSVELTPRSALSIQKPFVEATIGGGVEPLRDSLLTREEITIGDRFGLGGGTGGFITNDKPFSFVLTQTQMNDRRGIDDVEASYIDSPPTPNKAYDTLELRRYNYFRRRFGYSGEFDFQPNDNHRYFLRATVAGYREAVNRQRLLYRHLGDSVSSDPADPNGFIATGASTQVALRDELETHRNSVFAAGGFDDFGLMTLDYRVAYVRATYRKPNDINTTFSGPTDLAVAYDNTTNPNFPTVKVLTPGVNVTDPAAYSLSKITNSVESDRDREWSYAANLSIPLHIIGPDDELKFGGEVRLRNKLNIPTDISYAGIPVGAPFSQFVGNGPFTYYDGHYMVGFDPSKQAIRALLNSLPATATLNDGGYFNDDENIYAGYVEFSGSKGPWSFVTGARVESTKATYRGISDVTDASGNTVAIPVSRSRDYTNVFPALQVRYQVTDGLLARASFSTGIARPGFLQTIQSSSVDIGAGTVTTGNPDLKPTYGYNFDASLEYYLPHAGIVSIGAFDKQFSDFIVTRTIRGSYPGIVGIALINTFENVPNAYVRGLEAQYVQRFTMLPGPFDGLGIDANYTYAASQVELRNGEKVLQPGTSKYTWNAAAFYEKGPVKIRLASQYVSSTLFGIGGSRAGDVFQDARLTLDLSAGYDLTRNISLYFNAKNLLDTPLRFYEGSENRPIQREFYDVTLEGGVRIRL